MQEPVVWAEPRALLTERVAPPAKPLRGALSFSVIAAVAWIVPVHTVAALVLGLAISALAALAGTQG